MKKLAILLFSILISFNSYGEWTEVAEDVNDNVFYLDKDTIKERNGYVYFWRLANRSKPDPDGNKSLKVFYQADCDLVRAKNLSVSGHSGSMGSGTSKDYSSTDWKYFSPDAVGGFLINYACNYVK